MLLYFIIFTSKIIENALSTLRMIVVSNGKKKLGAFLNGIIAIVWILVTGVVIIDINKDVFKIIFFCLGSIVGSYLGSVIEEKIALGSNMILAIIESKYINLIENILNNKDYYTTFIDSKNKDISLLIIMVRRKKVNQILKTIKRIDENAIVIAERARTISDKFVN